LLAGCSPSLQKFAAPPAVVYCGLPNRKRFSASPILGFAVEKTYLQKYTTHLPDTQGIVTFRRTLFCKALSHRSHAGQPCPARLKIRLFSARLELPALYFFLFPAEFVKNFVFPSGFFSFFE
jgi:hypothetical protein